MKRVTGVGGIFFKSADPQKLADWYERHLGIEKTAGWAGELWWRDDADPAKRCRTVFGVFARDDDYFEPTTVDYMVNFRVENLDEVLEHLQTEGVEIDNRREDYDYGRFAWMHDPEGRRIELWEPAAR